MRTVPTIRQFQTTGPWTRAGGVTSDLWPQWISPYPDFYFAISNIPRPDVAGMMGNPFGFAQTASSMYGIAETDRHLVPGFTVQ